MKDPIKLRTIFMGTSSFAEKILGALIENKYNIISVYTRADKKIEREQMLQKSVIKTLAEKNKLKVFEPEKFDEKTIAELKNQKPDIIVVAAYGKILPAAVLKIPGFGFLNVHASFLPKFRGPSPVQNAILEGMPETGTTIMLMDEGIDTGDVLDQKKIKIDPNETYQNLLEEIAVVSSKLLLETIPRWIERKIIPQKQDGSRASYCQLIERQDGKIIWVESALSIYNRFRAFYPWPGIFTYWEKNGYNLRLKIHQLSLAEKNSETVFRTGEVFELDGKIAVQTGKGAISLEEIQIEGKSKTSIADFINGHPEFIGSVLK